MSREGGWMFWEWPSELTGARKSTYLIRDLWFCSLLSICIKTKTQDLQGAISQQRQTDLQGTISEQRKTCKENLWTGEPLY